MSATVRIRDKGYVIAHPNICLYCHVKVNPAFLGNFSSTTSSGGAIEIGIWRCSNDDCQKIIVAEHYFDSFKTNQMNVRTILNGQPLSREWPKPIAGLGAEDEATGEFVHSKFMKIYEQASIAESKGLDEIAGMGYRKAVEFLVKDWITSNQPEIKDVVKNKFLGNVIKDHYEGELKDILDRAVWLGNDETHYTRVFEEFDISDLKELIDLVVTELDKEWKKKWYVEKMEKKKGTL